VRNKIIILTVAILVMGTAGCRWRDDFRDRQQPQMLELPIRATLNPDSRDYVGDDTKDAQEAGRRTRLRNIDELSEIPESPEHPSGM
jgi:hypothetical protein